MIFAELEYKKHYSEIHDELVDFIKSEFPNIEHGLQGDSWIWIFDNNDKVAIDTFSSMKHQIKTSNAESALINKIIHHVSTPELEVHE